MVSISDCSWSWTPVSESESSGMANEDFANYVDYILPQDVVHINNNMRDPVPIVACLSGTTIVGARSTSK